MTAFQCHLPICSGLPASSLVTLPIVPNSGGDLWWFAVKCGGLWWFAVVCGGLGWFAVICLLVIPIDIIDQKVYTLSPCKFTINSCIR